MILPLINVKLQNELYILIDIYEELIFLTLFLFLIGLSIIVLNQKNLIISLIGVEIVLLAANISFLATAWFYQDPISLIFILCILVISAVETALGTGIVILCYAVKKTVSFNDLTALSD